LLFPAEEMKNRSTFRLDLLSASCVLDKWHGRLLDHSSSRSIILWQQITFSMWLMDWIENTFILKNKRRLK
jgi:hypothetical protein